MNQIRESLRFIGLQFAAIPLAIIALFVVAYVLAFRKRDDNPYIDGGDDDSDANP